MVEIPAGFRVENLPPPAEVKSRFGFLKSDVKADGNRVTLCRQFEMEQGQYPAGEFNAFVEFLRQIAKQDKSKVVVVR